MEQPQSSGKNKTRGGGANGAAGGQKPKGTSARTLSIIFRLLGYMRAYRGTVILLVLGFFLSTALSLLPATLVRATLDVYLVPEKARFLWLLAAAVVGAALLQGFVDFLTRYFAGARGQLVVYTIRQDVYRHLLSQSFAYFDHARIGDVMARVTEDAQRLQRFFGSSVVYIISHSLFLLGILAVLFAWNTTLALLYLCMMPFIIHGMTRYTFRVRPAYRTIRRILGRLTAHIQEQLQGIQVIKLFGREPESAAMFNQWNEQYYKNNVEAGRITAFWQPYAFVIIGLATGVLMWLGGVQVIRGSISLGTLVGFSTYIGMLMRPIRQTGVLLSQTLSAAAAGERIFEVLDAAPDVRDREGARPMPKVRGDVEYRGVHFSYDKQTPLLKDISFSAKAGETIAVVGPTGAGKTTLVHLLPRFYEIDAGAIFIDKTDIRDVTVASLRENIGIVMQQTFLFHATLRENIAMGKRDATLEEIRRAAQAAQIDDFIIGLPDGYDTVVGERGVRLSGGQRQRVSIARTLLMDPRILIMDEPTSGVDAKTDEKIQNAVENLCKDRSVFIIAHRLWTLRNADRILVISDGRVAQFDTHENLLKQDGLYRELYRLHMQGKQGETLPEGGLLT